MSMKLRLAGMGGAAAQTYVDDVFSTYLYTGTGAAQTINNGIDLAGKGGLVWIKKRSESGSNHKLTDTVRGATKALISNTTGAQTTDVNGLTAFSSTGFSLGTDSTYNMGSSRTFVSWTFREAPKFFDIVTYTGNGTLLTVNHNLGVAPGMIIVKRLNGVGAWNVYHRSLTASNYYLLLNTSGYQQNGSNTWGAAPTSTTFTVGNASGGDNGVNASGGTYVAYLFAHDTSSTGIIQCGSFTTSATLDAITTVTLGWEPQYVLYKSIAEDNWKVLDSMRGMVVGSDDATLEPNTTTEETVNAGTIPAATGFYVKAGTGVSTNATYIYMAIRRPNKPPTTGTQVYNAVAYTGNGTDPRNITGFGFPVDLIMQGYRDQVAGFSIYDRLRGAGFYLRTPTTNAEANGSIAQPSFALQDGDQVALGNNTTSNLFIQEGFKRALGFFDVVCYTGTGTNNANPTGSFAGRSVEHSLGVPPELVLLKDRTGISGWWIFSKQDATKNLRFTTAAFENNTVWLNSQGTSNLLYVEPNTESTTYVAYLFATLAGISKVGSYTGNGTTQTINCGFSTGARFVLIKRTDSTGDWFVWDTARGIVAANDPHLSLNTTAAEVTTDDSIDPDSTGFIVNQVAATNINVNAGTYIFLAIS